MLWAVLSDNQKAARVLEGGLSSWVLATVAEDLSLVPSTLIKRPTATYSLSSRRPDTLFCPRHARAHTHTHIF